MSSFEITGGYKLHGTINPQGAKNEALQVLCATLLTSDKVTIDNIPDIRDVNKLIGLLQLLGVSVRRLNDDSTLLTEGRNYEFQANAVNLDVLEGEEFAQQATALRGSIMIVGPLLSRNGSSTRRRQDWTPSSRHPLPWHGKTGCHRHSANGGL